MKKFEKILIVIILLLSVASMGFMTFTKSNHSNNNIVIKVDNKVVNTFPLNNSKESKVYGFKFNNNTAYVETKNGSVRMIEMSKELCPKGICSKTGWIDKSYQSIVCLPNKIVVTVQGDGQNEQEEQIDILL